MCRFIVLYILEIIIQLYASRTLPLGFGPNRSKLKNTLTKTGQIWLSLQVALSQSKYFFRILSALQF